jgi:hypothetical protein
MRRSTRTEEDWLFGRTSDTSSGDLLKGGNKGKLQQHGRNPAAEVVGLLYSEVEQVGEPGVRTSEEPCNRQYHRMGEKPAMRLRNSLQSLGLLFCVLT